MTIEQWGAFAFGLVIGWFAYFTNRYRKGEAQLSDLATLIGIIGGGAVTTLFGAASGALFAAYGIGLASGFFAYFLALVIMVANSGGEFTVSWFLDGRRKPPADDFGYDENVRHTVAPMAMRAPARSEPAERLAPAAALVHGARAQSPLESATAERDRAIQALADAVHATADKVNATQDTTERERLRAAGTALRRSMQDLLEARLHDIATNPENIAAIAALKHISKDMQKTAGEIKAATDFLKSANDLIQNGVKAVGILTGIFGG